MNNNRGFTLIEAMIVVVVIAILAAISFPAYQNTIHKARRAEAKSSLLQVAHILERCFTQFNKYNAYDAVDSTKSCPTIAAGPTINLTSDTAPLNGEGYYTITSNNGAETLTSNRYTLTATPTTLGGQDNDTQCATFTLSNTGLKGATSNNCWE